MNCCLPTATERSVDSDAIDGANFLYHPFGSPPNPEAYTPDYLAGSGTYNQINNMTGHRGTGWTLSSPWTRAYNQDVVYSNSSLASSFMWFTGSRITRRATMANNRGTRTVYIDGTPVDSISDYAAQTRWQTQRTWTVPNGVHFLEIRGPGTTYIDLDALIVDIGYLGAGTYDNTSGTTPQFIGSGWSHNSSGWPSAYNSSLSFTATAEDATSLTFYGSQIVYKYTKASNRGKAAITIDGIDYGLLDLYSSTTAWQQTTSYLLTAGVHTIHVSVSGQKHSSSSGYYIDVDSFQVIP